MKTRIQSISTVRSPEFRVFRFKDKHSNLRTHRSELLFGNKGFTLIEVIILIVLAGILLPAILVPFAAGVKGSGKSENVTTAIYLAHQKMEEFMKFNYNSAALNPIALTPYADADISYCQWQWEIVYVDHHFNPWGADVGYKRILVRVKDMENDTYEIYSVVTRFP